MIFNQFPYRKILIGLLGLGSQIAFAGSHAVHEASPAKAVLAGTPVGCTQAELTAAINNGNAAGTATLQLPSACNLIIVTPATVNEAFPAITGNITLIGGEGTVIARDQTAAAFRLFTVNVGGTLTLKNLAIENGTTAGLGGGVLVQGTLVVDSVSFSHNNAANGGAFSVSAGGVATVSKGNFLLNTTTGVGGGAILNSGEITVKNSTFSGNTAPINGGAINTQGSGITSLILCLFTSNTSNGLGGALSNLGTTRITQTIIHSNNGSSGGGIATGNNNVFVSHTSNTAIINNIPNNCNPLNTIANCTD